MFERCRWHRSRVGAREEGWENNLGVRRPDWRRPRGLAGNSIYQMCQSRRHCHVPISCQARLTW